MIKDAYTLVYELNEAFGKGFPYSESMAAYIIKHFKDYTPESLTRVFELILQNYGDLFKPPPLATIFSILKLHNDNALKENQIRPGTPQKQIEDTTGCVSPEKSAKMLDVILEIAKNKSLNKEQKKAQFEKAKEIILHGIG